MVNARRWRHWATEAGIGLAALLVVLAFGLAVLPPLTRPLYDRWGATDPEVIATLPGDDLVPDAESASTKAVTIEAPADIVYSLVVQMGYRRAGWYGWDWFYDMTGSSGFVDGGSSRRIVPELQDLATGDRVYINRMVGYDVMRAERPRLLLLFGGMTAEGRTVAGNDAEAHTKMSWAWVVEPVDADTTRLILRVRSGGKSKGAFADWLYGNPLDLGGAVFGHKTLTGLKGVAEDLAARR